jgi:6-phosphogluconolactonase
MSATIFRVCSVPFLLLVLSLLLAGCGSGQVVSCGAPANANCPVIPGPEFLYATSNSNAGQILAFTIDRKTGALGAPATIPGPAMSSGIASAQNQFLYVSDTQNGAVDAFSINQATGALTTVPGSPFSPGGTPPFFPLWLVAGTDLYATGFTGTSGFTIAANGALTPVVGSPFSGGAGGQAALGQSNTTPINYFLYATNLIDPNGTISAFKVDPVSGILTTIPGNFTTGPFASPDGIVFDGTLGPFVFVALNLANKIAAFSVDPTTGVLTPVPGSAFDAGFAPVFLALSASQNFLYAMNFFDRSISAYTIASNGALTQVSGSPLHSRRHSG